MGVPGLRPDLIVVSAKDAAFTIAPTLVDVIDARRWRCGHCVIELPLDHAHVGLRAPDGAELRFTLTSDKTAAAGGDVRLLLVEAPDNSTLGAAPFRLAAFPARGDWERLTRDQIVRSSARLVWAISQRRRVERRDGAAALAHLWPAQRAFPTHQSRIVLEPIATPIGRASSSLKAPFAIMENWLRENGAPCPALRIRIPHALDESELMLARTSIALVLHQRRRFREWVREQRDAGEPIVDPLTFDDLRAATDHPLEQPEAVEADRTIVVHNLLDVILAPDSGGFDGISVKRLPESAGDDKSVIVDVYFFAAALGDDVGLVNTAADVGDFGVVPSDPGGASNARLFRVESNGLAPRRVGEDDPSLYEALRLAADEQRKVKGGQVPADGERPTSLQARREKLLAGFNASLAAIGYAGRFETARLWDALEPISMSSFAALAADAAPEGRAVLSRIGGYEAYRSDPSLAQAAARLHEVARTIDEAGFRERRGDAGPLTLRFIAACGIPELAQTGVDLAAQLQIWRVLSQPSLTSRLTRTRLSLAGAEDLRQIAHVTELLLEEAIVERSAIYCDDLELDEQAQSLRDYLARRRDGEWTKFEDAMRLSVIVDEANAYWRQIEAGRSGAGELPARAQAPAKPEGLLATMRNFLLGGGSRGLRP